MNTQHDTGLNGKFGKWLKRKMKQAVSLLASTVNSATLGILSETLQAAEAEVNTFIDENTDGGFWSRTLPGTFPLNPTYVIESDEPTTAEQSILDRWFDSKFLPFYKNLLLEVQNAFAKDALQTQIEITNKAMLKMCVIREYYLLNETSGLSQNAVNVRMQLINELLVVVDQLIASKMTMTANSTTVYANDKYFNGLFENSVQDQKYTCKQFATKNTGLPEILDPVKTTPTFPVPVNDTDEEPQNEEEVDDEKPLANKVDKTFKYVGYGLIALSAIGVLKSVFKKKSKQ